MLVYTFAPIINGKTEKEIRTFNNRNTVGVAYGLEERLVFDHKATLASVAYLSIINKIKVEQYEKDNFIYAHFT